MARFRDLERFRMRLHFEIASVDHEGGFLSAKLQFGSIEGQDEIIQFEVTLVAADHCPLLIGGDERAIKGGRNLVLEEEFTGEVRGDRCWAIRAGELG